MTDSPSTNPSPEPDDNPPSTAPRRVLILMSDTGGGHRAVAEAIRDALVERHGNEVSIEIVDVFRSYTPFPFKYAPEIYPMWVKRGRFAWRAGYRLTNRQRGKFVLMSLGEPVRRGLRRLLKEHETDVIVSAHPLFNTLTLNLLRRQALRPPFITVVTDLVSTHSFWYDRNADRILVPTEPAYNAALALGIRPDQIRVTGLPVRPQFLRSLLSKDEARTRLGWDATLPAILMIGGGDGMGPLFQIARRINLLNRRRRLRQFNAAPTPIPFQLVIVAGRNKVLRERLEGQKWNQPTQIYPFITNMPELMAAADLLITKAGPTTICEGCIAGLPMILSSAIPGQEDGNVEYLTAHGAGIYAPGPRRVARAVQSWLTAGPTFLRERGEKARQLAQPDAVWEVADEIWHYAGQPKIERPPRAIRRFRPLRLNRNRPPKKGTP